MFCTTVLNYRFSFNVRMKGGEEMMKYLKKAVVFALLVSMFGCGTIMHGSQQDVSISAPNNALVKVGDKSAQGSTVMKLDRDKSYTVAMKKDGKEQVCGQINKSMSGGVILGDIFLLPPIGFIVDAITGAWYNLEPTQVTCPVN